MTFSRTATLRLSIATLLLPPAIAQTADAPPTFDVASIKPSDPGHFGAQMYSPSPGRFTALTATVRNLVTYACQVRDIQVRRSRLGR